MAILNFDKISAAFATIGNTLASVVKILLLSRHNATKIPCESGSSEIVILANGPSLNTTMQQLPGFLQRRTLLAVNFAMSSPEIFALHPKYYVLADGHFFKALNEDNVTHLWQKLNAVTWQMFLFVPVNATVPSSFSNQNVRVVHFNTTPVEGAKWLRHAAYTLNLGMPRPRNVLVASIMLSIALGFHKIYLAGADHSWLPQIYVDNHNHVITGGGHFYKDEEKELKRIKRDYVKYPLHQILESYSVAFRSYHLIRDYVDSKKNVEILNITPDSFIDAFNRCNPSDCD